MAVGPYYLADIAVRQCLFHQIILRHMGEGGEERREKEERSEWRGRMSV